MACLVYVERVCLFDYVCGLLYVCDERVYYLIMFVDVSLFVLRECKHVYVRLSLCIMRFYETFIFLSGANVKAHEKLTFRI
jgi:hypothetical protein